MAAAVLLPAFLVALGAEGLFLAEADGADAVGRDALRDDVLLDGSGAAVAEAEVVFGGAAFVAMALDGDLDRGIVAEEFGGLGEGGAGIGANVGLVEVEVSVANFLEEEFVERRFGRFDYRRRSGDGDAGAGFCGAAGATGADGIRGGAGRRDVGGALGSYGTDVGGDGNLRGVGGGPAQG